MLRSCNNNDDNFVIVPPHIHTLINQTAQEGQSQTLTCRADGDPAPKMTFQKVGNELPYEIGDGNVSLLLALILFVFVYCLSCTK